MSDIDTMIAEVRRLRVDENEDDAPECSMCGDTYQLRDGCDKTAVCDLCAQRIAEEYAPSLARACEEQRGEIERLQAEAETANGHVRALVNAMAEWGSWEDGVPAAGDSGCGKVGDAYDAAKAYLAAKGAGDEVRHQQRILVPSVRTRRMLARGRDVLRLRLRHHPAASRERHRQRRGGRGA